MIWFFIMSNEQTHPLHATDKKIIDSLISKEIDKFEDCENLAELTFKKRYPDGASKDFKELQKQKMFLTNKGFTFFQIESVLD